MFIGNDVVDLRDPETFAQQAHPRFPARVCIDSELLAIYSAGDPIRMLWVHWAAKESAFKALCKHDTSIRFIPRNFRVELRNGCDGGIRHAVVHHGNQVLAVEVTDAAHHLHAIARLLDSEQEGPHSWQVNAFVRHIHSADTEDASRLGRELLCTVVADRLCLAATDISVSRTSEPRSVPRLLIRGTQSPIDVSLSHHGSLVACAFTAPFELPLPDTGDRSH